MRGLDKRPPVLLKETEIAMQSEVTRPVFKEGEDLRFEHVSVYRPDGECFFAECLAPACVSYEGASWRVAVDRRQDGEFHLQIFLRQFEVGGWHCLRTCWLLLLLISACAHTCDGFGRDASRRRPESVCGARQARPHHRAEWLRQVLALPRDQASRHSTAFLSKSAFES